MYKCHTNTIQKVTWAEITRNRPDLNWTFLHCCALQWTVNFNPHLHYVPLYSALHCRLWLVSCIAWPVWCNYSRLELPLAQAKPTTSIWDLTRHFCSSYLVIFELTLESLEYRYLFHVLCIHLWCPWCHAKGGGGRGLFSKPRDPQRQECMQFRKRQEMDLFPIGTVKMMILSLIMMTMTTMTMMLVLMKIATMIVMMVHVCQMVFAWGGLDTGAWDNWDMQSQATRFSLLEHILYHIPCSMCTIQLWDICSLRRAPYTPF